MSRDRFKRFYANGENPNGMVAVTPNGISTDRSDGVNHQSNYAPGIHGSRWEMPMPDRYADTPFGPGASSHLIGVAHKTGNRNRSGE